MKLTPRHAFLLILLLASLAYHGTRVYLSASSLLDPGSHPSAPFRLESHSPVVRSVEPEAAAAGLKAGDRIVTIGGRELRGYGDLGRALADGARIGVVPVTVSRPAGPLTLTLPLTRAAASEAPARELAAFLVLEVILPLFFLGVGLTLVWFKPTDRAAWILLYMMETFSNLASSTDLGLERLGPQLGAVAAVWFAFFASSWAFAMLAFALVFPEPLPLDQRKPWLKWLVLAPLLAVAVITAGINLSILDFSWGGPFLAVGRAIGRAGLILVYIAMSLFFWTLGFKSGTTKAPDALRRLRILLVGAGVAMTPAALIATTALLTGRSYSAAAPQFVLVGAGLMMLIFPLTLAYVVIVHKAMGVGMVIRQGLQYALARRAVRVVQILIGFGVAVGLVQLLSDPRNRAVDRLRWIGLAVFSMAMLERGASRFRRWIDKRFFREAVDAERILADLGDRVRSIADPRQLLENVARTVSEALHTPKVAAFVRGANGFAPAYATGYEGNSLAIEFGNAGVLTCCVEALQKPQTIYLDDQRSWVRRENIPEDEAAKLRALESEVLIPLRTGSAVEGFLSLGPKTSEAAYSPSDLRLLQSVANQTALALDNSRLVAQVAREVASRERMTREIEIAREVQFTLLPQKPPRVEGLDLAGHCRPAAGIGGDYYDFIPLDGERAIGIAIGDIAGKGIPAALLMAGLQAALRGQSLVGSRDLARIMVNINKLIFESSPGNRYATFFYGEYRSGRLAYVNAGHNAPLLLRADGRMVRLEEGGPVIGLMEAANFVEGSVDIAAGDLLLGFTDGISEAMNPADEEWGEGRLFEITRRYRSTSSADLVGRIMVEADLFAAGARQHDDMTLIVVKAAADPPGLQ